MALLLPIPDPFDLTGVLGAEAVRTASAVLGALREDFLRGLALPLSRFVLHTPDLLAEPTLRRFWLVSLAAATSCAGLLVAVAGVAVSTGGSGRWGQAARTAVAVRLPGCLLTAAVSLPLVALEAGLANRLVDAYLDGAPTGSGQLLLEALGPAAGDGLAVLVTAVVGVALLTAVAVTGLARWATLWLVVVLAPLAMAVGLLPGGEPVVRAWWRLQAATTFLPVAHAALLGTYAAMFASQRTGLLGALAGVAVLALMAKLPSLAAGVAVGADAADVARHARHGGARARQTVRAARRVVARVP